MKRAIAFFSMLLILLLLFSACDWLPAGKPATTGEGTTEARSTLPATVTLPATEPPTTAPGEYPNEPDDDHSKRY